MNSNSSFPAAVIFDMDGVLVDSNPFHLQKWIAFLNEHGIPYVEEDLPKQILGSRNDSLFRRFFGPQITPQEMRRLGEEVEANFRKAFAPHARPLPGLERLVEEIHRQGIPIAVASSAIGKNVAFVIEALKFRAYLRTTVSGDEVVHAGLRPGKMTRAPTTTTRSTATTPTSTLALTVPPERPRGHTTPSL